jgi:hypothetical protein
LSSAVVRCALVLFALLAGAWLVVGYRAVELESDGQLVFERVAQKSVTAGAVEDALDKLRDARTLNLDKSPLIAEGVLLASVTRPDEARKLARRVVADEPDNLEAWRLMYVLATDRREEREARRRVAELNPYAERDLQPLESEDFR